MTILSTRTLAATVAAAFSLAGAARAAGGGDGLCDGKTRAETNLDFFAATVKENTLHEGGKIVYENIGVVRDNPVNLVVTVVDGTKYSTTKPEKNGKAGGGMFGNINLQTFKKPKDKDGLYDGNGNFQFCFRDTETDDLVEVDSFQWSVYDLDERNHAPDGIKEKLIIDATQASDYVLYPDIEGSEVKLSCEDGSATLPCGPGVRTVFHSSTKGVGADNPKDKDNMTEQQLKRSVIFRFDNRSCWTFTYSHYCPPDEADPANSKGCQWYGGGNFLYAGEAKQLIEEGECITKPPTAAPTELPTAKPTESPTVKPTASPTGSPTAAPTVKRTDRPTGSPTGPPTDVSDSMLEPTASPTKGTEPPIVTNGGDDDDDFFFSPSCPEDVTVVKQVGATELPDPNQAVQIVSQDLSTVTVKLNQAWSSPGDEQIPIDHIYYSFMEDSFDEKCYEEDQVLDGNYYDTITIQCDVTKPFALLTICVADDIANEKLTVEDDAVVPKCCHPSFPEETPVVCYTFEINCVTECVEEEVKERQRKLLRGSRA